MLVAKLVMFHSNIRRWEKPFHLALVYSIRQVPAKKRIHMPSGKVRRSARSNLLVCVAVFLLITECAVI